MILPNSVLWGQNLAEILFLLCLAFFGEIDFKNNEASSDIVFNKTRAAPLKAITIPRLELLTALMGACVIKFLKGQLPVHRICLHSYSSCVLGWIESKKTQPAFVEKRLAEIRENLRVKFNHVPSELNPADMPADMPSRGQPPTANTTDLWWHGPPWLRTCTDHSFPLPEEGPPEVQQPSFKKPLLALLQITLLQHPVVHLTSTLPASRHFIS